MSIRKIKRRTMAMIGSTELLTIMWSGVDLQTAMVMDYYGKNPGYVRQALAEYVKGKRRGRKC